MHKRIALTSTMFAILAGSSVAHADLRVIATVPDLASLAREVGGKHVKVEALSLHTQDPHFVDAKPSLVLAANKADMLIAVGLDLEVGWLPILQRGARNGKIQTGSSGYVECSHFVPVLERARGKVDRSSGDVHPGGNPHYLHDPRRGLACAAGIAARMMALDPSNADAYRQNLARFQAAMKKRIADWERRLARYRGTTVVTYHTSWSYLLAWLGFEHVGSLEPKPGIAPTPRHLAQLIKTARARKVRLLFQETYYPARTAHLVAGKIGATLLSLDGSADVRGGASYVDRIEAVVAAVERALE